MCDAFDITPLDASGTGAAALARLESYASEETSAAAAFWAALGSGADRSAMIPIACMAVVRADSRPAAGSPPPVTCGAASAGSGLDGRHLQVLL